jgi:Ni,Fe-hydrogenase I cytochrome b subunit
MPPDEQANFVESLMSRLGVSSKFAKRVKFGGIVGKLALLGIFGVISAATIGLKMSQPVMQLSAVAAVVLIVLFIGSGILLFGHKHPEQATLEGLEIVAWQHQVLQAAKGGIEFLPGQSPIPDPNNPLPIVSDSEAEKE